MYEGKVLMDTKCKQSALNASTIQLAKILLRVSAMQQLSLLVNCSGSFFLPEIMAISMRWFIHAIIDMILTTSTSQLHKMV